MECRPSDLSNSFFSQAPPDGINGKLQSGVNSHLFEYTTQTIFDRLFIDVQPLCDLFVAITLRYELENSLFAIGERRSFGLRLHGPGRDVFIESNVAGLYSADALHQRLDG